MTSKKLSLTLSSRGYKNLRAAMKKMGFSNNSLFLRYCLLNTIRIKAKAGDKKLIEKEIKMIKDRK